MPRIGTDTLAYTDHSDRGGAQYSQAPGEDATEDEDEDQARTSANTKDRCPVPATKIVQPRSARHNTPKLSLTRVLGPWVLTRSLIPHLVLAVSCSTLVPPVPGLGRGLLFSDT